jgi:hypothetical protein
VEYDIELCKKAIANVEASNLGSQVVFCPYDQNICIIDLYGCIDFDSA